MKDNVMDIDMLKLLKNKNGSKELFDSIGKAYIEVVSDKIMLAIDENTIDGKTLQEIKNMPTGHGWLPEVVHSLIHSSRAVINMEKALEAILEGSKEFTSEFEDNTTAEITYNKLDGRGDYTKEINAEITLTAKSGAEDIFRALSIAYYGGEYELPEKYRDDKYEGPLVLDGNITYNPKLMEEASERVRDYMVVNYQKDMEKRLDDDLKKELKDALSK